MYNGGCVAQILVRDGQIDPVEHTGLMEIKKNPNLQPAPNDLSRWIAENQWAALDALCTHVPVFGSFSKEMDKNSDDWEKYCSHERPEDAKMPGDWGKVRALHVDCKSIQKLPPCTSLMG